MRASVLADRDEIHHRPGDPRRAGVGASSVTVVSQSCPSRAAAHRSVAGAHAGADDSPVAAFAGPEQVVQVHGLVRPVKVADADMEDAGAQSSSRA